MSIKMTSVKRQKYTKFRYCRSILKLLQSHQNRHRGMEISGVLPSSCSYLNCATWLLSCFTLNRYSVNRLFNIRIIVKLMTIPTAPRQHLTKSFVF